MLPEIGEVIKEDGTQNCNHITYGSDASVIVHRSRKNHKIKIAAFAEYFSPLTSFLEYSLSDRDDVASRVCLCYNVAC